MKYNIITLSNGLKVANFSSPHEFKFEDGSLLPECTPEHSEKYKVSFIETLTPVNRFKEDEVQLLFHDVELMFNLSSDVWSLIKHWKNFYFIGLVDIVLIPMPMLVALKEQYDSEWIKQSPFRVIRIEDRINKLVSISKFCI